MSDERKSFLLITHHSPLITSSKLFKEAHVVLEEEAYVVEFVHQSAHTVYAEAEGEAGELFGVNLDGAKHVRMHHPRPAEFDPAGAFAETAAHATTLKA